MNGMNALKREAPESSLAPSLCGGIGRSLYSAPLKTALTRTRLPACEQQVRVSTPPPYPVCASLQGLLQMRACEDRDAGPGPRTALAWVLAYHRHSLVLSNPPSETCTGDTWWGQ